MSNVEGHEIAYNAYIAIIKYNLSPMAHPRRVKIVQGKRAKPALGVVGKAEIGVGFLLVQ